MPEKNKEKKKKKTTSFNLEVLHRFYLPLFSVLVLRWICFCGETFRGLVDYHKLLQQVFILHFLIFYCLYLARRGGRLFLKQPTVLAAHTKLQYKVHKQKQNMQCTSCHTNERKKKNWVQLTGLPYILFPTMHINGAYVVLSSFIWHSVSSVAAAYFVEKNHLHHPMYEDTFCAEMRYLDQKRVFAQGSKYV